MTRELPPVAEVIPHSGNMLLLSDILSHDPEGETVCLVIVDQVPSFRDAAGHLPSWIGLELMAQCVAVYGGLVDRERGDPPRLGFLLGSRSLVFHRVLYNPGQRLEVSATRTWGAASGMVSFDCAVRDAATAEILAEGRLNCFIPEKGVALEALP
ncbi:MAG: 3-hydroxylacyl-ACP dehydratase [bacterium]|nr:3-hydroxylacyl-ACP dehydratase [bacterium]